MIAAALLFLAPTLALSAELGCFRRPRGWSGRMLGSDSWSSAVRGPWASPI